MKLKAIYHCISAAFLLSASFVVAADPGATTAHPQSANVGTTIDDAAITAKVKAKYLTDTRLNGAAISVTTLNGMVTLTGSAPTSDAKDAAAELAKSVSGVASVDNDLKTPSVASKIEKKTKHAAKSTKRVVSDSWITTKVKSSLLADSITKGFEINVKTVNKNVVLSGTVDTQASVDQAENLAKKIDGVTSVDTAGLTVSKK